MPRKQVQSLYRKTLPLVNSNIWTFAKQHWNSNCVSCKTQLRPDLCLRMKHAKEKLTLPSNIIQDIFDFVPYKSRCLGLDKELRHLICFLLYNAELKMGTFSFFHKDDTLFLMKYGQNIQSLCFVLPLRKCDETVFKTQLEVLWRPLLFSANNIQVLNIGNRFSLADHHLEIIGRECTQLQSLEGLKLKTTVTPESFEKFCFSITQDSRILNNCCNTLQMIDIYYYGDDTELRRLIGILDVLFHNVPNLKSFGRSFDARKYLESAGPDAVLNTSLEETIIITNLNKDFIPLLKSFCPKAKHFHVNSSELCTFETLRTSYPRLEKITFKYREIEGSLLFTEITTPLWSHLKYLHIDFTPIVVDLSIIAKQLPALEELRSRNCERLKWDGVTYFKRLERAYFCFVKACSISGIAALSRTIKSLCFETVRFDCFHSNMLTVLSTASFPVLTYLDISYLLFDFQFVVSVIKNCLMLEKMLIFEKDLMYENNDNIAIKQMLEFLQDGNYECDIFKSII